MGKPPINDDFYAVSETWKFKAEGWSKDGAQAYFEGHSSKGKKTKTERPLETVRRGAQGIGSEFERIEQQVFVDALIRKPR